MDSSCSVSRFGIRSAWIAGGVTTAVRAAALITLLVIGILALKGNIPAPTCGYVVAGLAGVIGLVGIGGVLLKLPQQVRTAGRRHAENTTETVEAQLLGALGGGAWKLAICVTLVTLGILAGRGAITPAVLAKVSISLSSAGLAFLLLGVGATVGCAVKRLEGRASTHADI